MYQFLNTKQHNCVVTTNYYILKYISKISKYCYTASQFYGAFLSNKRSLGEHKVCFFQQTFFSAILQTWNSAGLLIFFISHIILFGVTIP